MLFSKKLLATFVIIAVISFLGFLTENIWLVIKKGYIDNRNMYFPFLLGYGLAVIVLYNLWGMPQNPTFFGKELIYRSSITNTIYYMLMVALCISIGELLLGNLVEKICKIQWWDYSQLPLHIGKYTTIPTSLGFALLITLFMRFCFSQLLNYFMSWNYNVLFLTAISLMLLMLGDFFYSAHLMFRNKKLIQRWCIVTAVKGF
ncbi:MAG: putative ABC transporter permease [Lachnospiraceae bacterium]|nr:putative ABC transporter permease [Lachnospiraceae bacterium]